MAVYKSNQVNYKTPCLTADEKGDLVTDKNTVTVDTSLALGDLLLFGKLPNGHEPVDGMIVSDQIDSNGTPLLTLTVGILNDAGTDLVATTNFLTTSATIGRTATGSITRFDQAAGLSLALLNAVNTTTDVGTKEDPAVATALLGRRNGDRIVAGKVTAAAATKVAGNVTLCLTYRAM